jgi:hypothetical protein
MSNETEQVTFPTQQDEQGFFFENADDKEDGILTKQYDNGGKVKKTSLSTGEEVQVRRLKGRENAEIKKYMGEDSDKYITAGITVASQVNGKKETFEFFDDLWMSDYNKLTGIYKDLNF